MAEEPEGKRTFGRPRCRYIINFKINLEKLGFREWAMFIWL